MNPYEIISDGSIQKYIKILGIEDSHIFESVLKGNSAINTALGMAVSNISGAVNPGGILGWMNLVAIKNDSKTFISNQIYRLNTTPNAIYNETSLNMLLFACMGYEMETWVNHKNRMSDVGRIAIGLFSSSKMQKWEEAVIARMIECVRWIYSSTLILLIHYIILCEKKEFKFNLAKLQEIAAYLITLYCSCDSAMECFIVNYKSYLSKDYNYIHDILLASEKPYKSFLCDLPLSKDDLRILDHYCSGSIRERILKDIEESTIK